MRTYTWPGLGSHHKWHFLIDLTSIWHFGQIDENATAVPRGDVWGRRRESWQSVTADPGQDHRSVGTLEPLWNLFDLTPEGRPMDWDEQLSYP